MPKRSTTETAISHLSKQDQAASDAKAEAMAKIPSPIFREGIKFASLVVDRHFNVRDDEEYGYKRNKELYESLKAFGLQKRNVMSLSLQPNGTLLVLAGNLRYDCMLGIRMEESAKRLEEGVPTDASNPLPFEEVFGLVYSDLTRDQETMLMTDHMLAKGLNVFETAKAIGEFWETNPGMTDARASVYFGMDKNKVRRLRMR